VIKVRQGEREAKEKNGLNLLFVPLVVINLLLL
jgi:hypothetical protein